MRPDIYWSSNTPVTQSTLKFYTLLYAGTLYACFECCTVPLFQQMPQNFLDISISFHKHNVASPLSFRKRKFQTSSHAAVTSLCPGFLPPKSKLKASQMQDRRRHAYFSTNLVFWHFRPILQIKLNKNFPQNLKIPRSRYIAHLPSRRMQRFSPTTKHCGPREACIHRTQLCIWPEGSRHCGSRDWFRSILCTHTYILNGTPQTKMSVSDRKVQDTWIKPALNSPRFRVTEL